MRKELAARIRHHLGESTLPEIGMPPVDEDIAAGDFVHVWMADLTLSQGIVGEVLEEWNSYIVSVNGYGSEEELYKWKVSKTLEGLRKRVTYSILADLRDGEIWEEEAKSSLRHLNHVIDEATQPTTNHSDETVLGESEDSRYLPFTKGDTVEAWNPSTLTKEMTPGTGRIGVIVGHQRSVVGLVFKVSFGKNDWMLLSPGYLRKVEDPTNHSDETVLGE